MSGTSHSRVALVTGAAQGVGYATARRLAADGFVVVLNDIADDGRVETLAVELGGMAVVADIAAPDTATEIVETVRARLGDIDVLVANAAAMNMAPFLSQAEDLWWRQIHVNLSGHFRLAQAVIPGMRRAGAGRIVIIASGAGVVGQANATAYSASKAGLIALAKGLGRELAPDGITVNAIAPSYIDTEQLRVDATDAGISLEEMRRAYRDIVPIGRLATAEEIAATVSFLVSRLAAAFVGQVLQPAGGVTRTRA